MSELPRALTRAERKAADRSLDEALSPNQWLFRRLIPYGAVLAFLASLQLTSDDAQMGPPIAATAIFWGMGLALGFLRRRQRAALGGGEPSGQREPERSAGREPLPVTPRATGAPDSVADIAELVDRVGAGLRRHKQGRLAERLEQGLGEVVRLAGLADAVGPEDQELRAEITRLTGRAEAAPDDETAELWRTSARAAEHRLEKAIALAAAADRTHARIESFRQTVKSLAVDLARLDLASGDPTMLNAVDQHGSSLERDVEALTRTNQELAGLERVGGPAEEGRAQAVQAQLAARRTV